MGHRLELHCHSVYSDGTLEPSELVDKGVGAKLDLMILTDHDSVSGAGELVEAGRQKGLDVRVGIEINCAGEAADRVHILGYGLRLDATGFAGRLAEFRERRTARARLMVEKLRGLGYALLEFEHVRSEAHETIGRPHVADALRRLGIVKSRQEAFDRFLATDKPGYVPPMGPSPKEAVELIKDAGGFACLAHPQTAGKEPALDELAKIGLDAVEVHYAAHTPSQRRAYGEWARSRGLLALGGTDYHGPRTGREGALGVEYDDADYGAFMERLARCS